MVGKLTVIAMMKKKGRALGFKNIGNN